MSVTVILAAVNNIPDFLTSGISDDPLRLRERMPGGTARSCFKWALGPVFQKREDVFSVGSESPSANSTAGREGMALEKKPFQITVPVVTKPEAEQTAKIWTVAAAGAALAGMARIAIAAVAAVCRR